MNEENNNSVWSQSISIKEQLSLMGWLIKTAKPAKYYILAALFGMLGGTVLMTYTTRLLANFMNNQLSDDTTVFSQLVVFALIFTFWRMILAVFNFIQNYFISQGAFIALSDIRVRLFDKLHSLGMRFFDQTPAGSLVTRTMNDTSTFWDFWFFIFQLLSAITLIIGAYIGMYMSNAHVTNWLLIIIPAITLIIGVYQKFSTAVYKTMRSKLSSLNAKIAESVAGIAVIQDFNQEARLSSEFQKINSEYYDSRYRMIKADAWLDVLVDLVYGFSLALTLYLLGELSVSNVIVGGTVYAFVNYLGNIFHPLRNLTGSMSTLQDATVSAYRVKKLFAEDEYAPEQNANAEGKITKGKIEFKNLNFSYDGKNTILKDLSFVAQPGQTIALVGHTGSGKSSTINALMRFYEFDSGEILLDDQPIRDIEMKNLRREMGLVLQEPYLFYGDINFNIRMYDETLTDEDIKRAAKFVGADKFIEKLPDGYKTIVREGGNGFSAGEKQLISFARTIAHNPKILILDEATSHIDTESEHLIQDALEVIQKDRTTIAIAHRLSTIQHADLILVLDQGQVVERGTHDELVKQDGRYAELVKLQTKQEM
ncbi:ABC transporter ATP-binding protein [Floricoccus penangensis]|uniref:ABC transporter ATP-binding protein n=1 Tax=Floricoccus penangensis TaxID=1859475 RepID=UPI00203E685B|nr:ABC transporter ATP-binding protein [Floricoccus penangensis]URZ86955.1 ABC transporter ATP-binding protein/permease [Floricoccus penangensis]